MKRLLLTSVALAVTAAGCSTTLQDLEGIDAQPPDKIEVFQSPDRYPNVMRVCIDGVPLALTTREYEPLTVVKEWNDWCGGQG